MEDRARELLKEAGVRSNLDEDELREILSGSGTSHTTLSRTPGSASEFAASSAISPGSGDFSVDNSLPSALIDELRSPSTRPSPSARHERVGQAVRREFELRIEQLGEQLENALQERRLSELDFQRQLKAAHEAVQQARQDAAASVAAARAGQTAAEAVCSQLRDKLDAVKSQFHDLHVSGGLWEELQRVPAEDLSLRNFILLRVHETVMPLHATIEQLRRTLDEKNTLLSEAEAVKARELRSLAAALASADVRQAGLTDQVEALQVQAKRLQTRLDDQTALVESLSAKGAAHDSLQAKVTELTALTSAMDRVRAGAEAVEERSRAAGTRIEELLSERATLVAALEESRASARIAKEEASSASGMLTTVRRELERVREDARLGAQADRADGQAMAERMDAELRRAREERELALSEVRSTMQTLFDRELRDARQARLEAEGQASQARQALEAGITARDAELVELRAVVSANATLIAELRSSLAIKSGEAESVARSLAEARPDLARSRDTCDMLKEALGEARLHVERAVAEAAVSKAGLEARISSLVDRLSVYETIEDGLDKAVLAAGTQAAGMGALTDDEGQGQQEDKENGGGQGSPALSLSQSQALLQSLIHGRGAGGTAVDEVEGQAGVLNADGRTVPTSAARRAAQAMELARQLAEARATVTSQETRITSLSGLLESSRAAEARLNGLLDAVQGPQEYMIAQVRAREGEIKTLKDELTLLRSETSTARKQVVAFQQDKERAEVEAARWRDEARQAQDRAREAERINTTMGHAIEDAVGPDGIPSSPAPGPVVWPTRRDDPDTGLVAEVPLVEGIRYDNVAPVYVPQAQGTTQYGQAWPVEQASQAGTPLQQSFQHHPAQWQHQSGQGQHVPLSRSRVPSQAGTPDKDGASVGRGSVNGRSVSGQRQPSSWHQALAQQVIHNTAAATSSAVAYQDRDNGQTYGYRGALVDQTTQLSYPTPGTAGPGGVSGKGSFRGTGSRAGSVSGVSHGQGMASSIAAPSAVAAVDAVLPGGEDLPYPQPPAVPQARVTVRPLLRGVGQGADHGTGLPKWFRHETLVPAGGSPGH